jgi:hypothetical protein
MQTGLKKNTLAQPFVSVCLVALGSKQVTTTTFAKTTLALVLHINEDIDAFVPPKPFASWLLNEQTAKWEAPVAMPDDGKKYEWNEDSQSWIQDAVDAN